MVPWIVTRLGGCSLTVMSRVASCNRSTSACNKTKQVAHAVPQVHCQGPNPFAPTQMHVLISRPAPLAKVVVEISRDAGWADDNGNPPGCTSLWWGLLLQVSLLNARHGRFTALTPKFGCGCDTSAGAAQSLHSQDHKHTRWIPQAVEQHKHK